MIWLVVLNFYAAPPNAVDWNGPWKLGTSRINDRQFATEAQCRNAAIELVGQMHQGMLAPIRFKCVGIAAGLPVDAPR